MFTVDDSFSGLAQILAQRHIRFCALILYFVKNYDFFAFFLKILLIFSQ